MIITIDGPSGTGKSTVARLLAKKLGFHFFDTGALYRAFAWWLFSQNISLDRAKEGLASFVFRIGGNQEVKRYYVNEIDVTEDIRTKTITEAASSIARIKEVREDFLPIQRAFGRKYDSVFEGRDLGSVVFPDADKKFFLTASPEVRAERRYKELLLKNVKEPLTKEEVFEDMQVRDHQDSSRKIAPLVCPEGAFLLDTSGLSAEEVVDSLINNLKQR